MIQVNKFHLLQDKPIEEMMRLRKEDIDKPISQADLDAALQRCKKTSDDVEVQRWVQVHTTQMQQQSDLPGFVKIWWLCFPLCLRLAG